MSATEITETVYDVVPNFNGRIMKFKFTGIEANDWVIFDNPIGAVKANLVTGADCTTAYEVGAIYAASGITSASTEMKYDGIVAGSMPDSGYIRMAGGEIIKYSGHTKANTTGTMDLDQRECFGTEAEATDAAEVEFYVLNTIVFTGATAGVIRGIAEIIDE